jgi:hypothetical protein
MGISGSVSFLKRAGFFLGCLYKLCGIALCCVVEGWSNLGGERNWRLRGLIEKHSDSCVEEGVVIFLLSVIWGATKIVTKRKKKIV